MDIKMGMNFQNQRWGSNIKWRENTSGDGKSIKNRRFFIYTFDVENGWKHNREITCVDVKKGKLYVNGIRILKPQITDDHITWKQYAKDVTGTHYIMGHLHLNSNGLEAHGSITKGTNQSDAIHYDVVATVIPSLKYDTFITSDRYSVDKKADDLPDSAWEPGLSLEISYTLNVGETKPSPNVKLDGQDISKLCCWNADDKNTILDIALDGGTCTIAEGLYAKAKLAFDAFQINAPGIGVVNRKCSCSKEITDTVQFWKAKLAVENTVSNGMGASSFINPMIKEINEEQLLLTDDDLNVNDLMTILPDDGVNNYANTLLTRNMKWAMGKDDKYKGWLKEFFNETPPNIVNTDELNIAKMGEVWYREKFSLAYLTQAFNRYDGPNATSHRLNDSQNRKLYNYLTEGLAKESDFIIQHHGVYINAYVGQKERLKSYINDNTSEYVGWAKGKVVFTREVDGEAINIKPGVVVKTEDDIKFITQDTIQIDKNKLESGPVVIVAVEPGNGSVVDVNKINKFDKDVPKGIDSVNNNEKTQLNPDTGGMKWAKKLFTTLTSGSQFILMVNRIAGGAGDAKSLGPVNNYACLLTALDTSGTIANNYYRSIISGVITKLVPDVVHRDKDIIMKWLPDTIKAVLLNIANGHMDELLEITAVEAKEMYEEYMKYEANINVAIAELLVETAISGSTNIISQAKVAETQFSNKIASRWPKFAKTGKLMFPILLIGSFSSVIGILAKGGWSKMSDVERGEFVLSVTSMAFVGFKVVPMLCQGIKAITIAGWNKFIDWCFEPLRAMEVEWLGFSITSGEGSLIEAQARNVSQMMEGATSTTAGNGTMFKAIFAEGKLNGCFKITASILAVAMVGFSIWQVISDFRKNGSVSETVFDCLTLAVNTLTAIVMVIEVFSVACWIPIAGGLLATVGIIIGFIGLFVIKPKNSLDSWMVDNGIPFVDKLPDITSNSKAVRVTFCIE